MDAEFRISRLERLGEMLEKGLITAAEFAEEKRKLFAADVNEVLLPSDNLDGGGLPLGQAAANDRVEPISEGPSPASAKQATAFQSEQLVDDHGEDRGSPTLPPKLWKFFVGLAGIFLMGDATGLRRQSLILIGLLICGAAYLYKSRNGNVSWLPQLNVRLTGTIGAFFIILPILGNQIILNERPEQEARGNYSALNNSDANYSASESEKHRHDPFAKENENLTSDDHLIEYAKKYCELKSESSDVTQCKALSRDIFNFCNAEVRDKKFNIYKWNSKALDAFYVCVGNYSPR